MNKNIKIEKIFFKISGGIALIVLNSGNIYAQLDEDITIKKDRKIDLAPANRVFGKIPPIKLSNDDKKFKYVFYDKKPEGVEEIKFTPNVIPPAQTNETESTSLNKFNNYISLGAGNFGRLYGNLHINSVQTKKMIYGLHLNHNSTQRGPIDNKNSAISYSNAELNGKYLSEKFLLKAGGGYSNDKYYFYGYKPGIEIDRQSIKQILNRVNLNIGFENVIPNAKVDYKLNTALKTLKDNYQAQETIWNTEFSSYFPIISGKLVALLDAESNITQRSDGNIDKRNLFKVIPSFNLNFNRISGKVGYRAINEFDEQNGVNATKGYPVAELTYKMPSLVHLFIGYNGDVLQNTLHGMLQENPYLKSRVKLLNTNKTMDAYAGIKGDLPIGIVFNGKVSYNNYDNFYYFNNYRTNNSINLADTSKFEILYDSLKVKTLNFEVEFSYQKGDFWRTSLKTNYTNYLSLSYNKPIHRPGLVVSWDNTFIFTDKLIANIDVKYIGRTFAFNSLTNNYIKNNSIIDLNTEFDYLFGEKFSCFVKLNNLLGKNYQRYLYYPKQGLNFLVGINYSF